MQFNYLMPVSKFKLALNVPSLSAVPCESPLVSEFPESSHMVSFSPDCPSSWSIQLEVLGCCSNRTDRLRLGKAWSWPEDPR